MYIDLRNLRDEGRDLSLYPKIKSFKIDNVDLPFLNMIEGESCFLHVLGCGLAWRTSLIDRF